MGGEAASPNNPVKGYNVNCKANIKIVQETHGPVITNAQIYGPG